MCTPVPPVGRDYPIGSKMVALVPLRLKRDPPADDSIVVRLVGQLTSGHFPVPPAALGPQYPARCKDYGGILHFAFDNIIDPPIQTALRSESAQIEEEKGFSAVHGEQNHHGLSSRTFLQRHSCQMFVYYIVCVCVCFVYIGGEELITPTVNCARVCGHTS